MRDEDSSIADGQAAHRAAKLWPHREHEANLLLSQFCRCGLHRWRKLDLKELLPEKLIRHCFWCSKVEVNGRAYEA